VQETGRRPLLVEADDEDGVVVAEPEQRVERHHEAALGLAAAPLARDLLETPSKRRRDAARRQDLGPVTGLREAVNGLANVADRAAVERESRRFDHRLVAVVDGA
jgi:hypothetical protein